MEKIIISGSAKDQKQVEKFVNHFKNDYKVIDYPKAIEGDFFKEYPKIHTDYIKNLEKADVYFLMNDDKKGIKGYVGSAGFGELYTVLYLKLVKKKKIKILIYKMPDKSVPSYDEIELWLKLGWISIYDKAI